MEPIKVGIVGGTGYTGVELLRLLARHPAVTLQTVTSRAEAGVPVAQWFPSLRGQVDLAFVAPSDAHLTQCDVVFFATPHGVAMAQAPALLEAGVKVIDLAADFRLRDPAVFAQWYGQPHACPDLLAQAVYGLPEVNRKALRTAQLVGMAGCYPTAVQLGLAPLLSSPDWVTHGRIIADCKSGVSGAGRKAEVGLLMAEAADNFKAYGVAGHRHAPEIVQGLQTMLGAPLEFTFVPHLVPMIRGILATIYVPIAPAQQGQDFQALFEARYANEPFVDVMPRGSLPETRSVRGANVLRIALHQPAADLLVILVVEDNLVKGASGQAIQVMNLMFGLEETCGLQVLPVSP